MPFPFRAPIGIFVFDIIMNGKRVPYMVMDTFFEIIVENPNALEKFPLDVYDGDDCYEMAMLTGSPQVYSWQVN